MAVKTTWPVEHACGHEQEHDLADKRPAERAGYANWLGKKDCTDCWQAGRGKENTKEKEARFAQRRAEEAATMETWERACNMPTLNGSDKAVAWGSRVRHQLIAAAHEQALGVGVSDSEFSEQVERHARKITSASWWIDQRDADPEDVAELVADAAADPAVETGSENPY